MAVAPVAASVAQFPSSFGSFFPSSKVYHNASHVGLPNLPAQLSLSGMVKKSLKVHSFFGGKKDSDDNSDNSSSKFSPSMKGHAFCK